MCDREHFDTLRDRVDQLEDDVKVYHARTDERLKTLFQTCEKLSSTAATLLRTALTILGIVLIVSVFALVYGAVGHDGFNAVTTSAPTAIAYLGTCPTARASVDLSRADGLQYDKTTGKEKAK